MNLLVYIESSAAYAQLDLNGKVYGVFLGQAQITQVKTHILIQVCLGILTEAVVFEPSDKTLYLLYVVQAKCLT